MAMSVERDGIQRASNERPAEGKQKTLRRKQKLEEEAEVAGKHEEQSKRFHEDDCVIKDLETERSTNLIMYHVIYSPGD